MEHFRLLLCCFIFFTSGIVRGSNHYHYHKPPTKLFVFGDSYADTGNLPKFFKSWHLPYGITFPGRPTGRLSDGRVLTDYIAQFMRIRSPIPFRWMKLAGETKIRTGMNFAIGGSGVFNVLFNGSIIPNMTTQIDFFQNLLNNSVYTRHDLKNSVVYVSLVGNDYGFYLANGGTQQGLQSFIPLVVNQLMVNLERIRSMGATKIALTGLQPLGCLPSSTILTSYQQCVTASNILANFHNQILNQTVARFNNQTKTCKIVTFDLYNSFLAVLNRTSDSQGVVSFQNPLRPCCIGKSSGFSCGDLDVNGTKQYTACSDPKSAFFWDRNHPTQAGWQEIFIFLKSTLQHLFLL